MKAEELMVGDWVVYDGDTEYDAPIKIEGMDISINSLITSDREDVGFDGVQPIPITREILEKNGFKKLDFYHFQIGDRRLVLDADGRWDGPLSWHWVVTEMGTNAKGQLVVLDYYVATINYVHELQHALRLCGIDKEIKL